MKKRLFIFTTLILFAGLLSYFAVSVYAAHTNNLRLAEDAVMETTELCAALYPQDGEPGDLAEFVRAGDDTRITVVSPSGEVLADSQPLDIGELENHLTRPEIEAAAADAPQTFVRPSQTLGADLIYYAVKVPTGSGADDYVFLRCALPVEKIDSYLMQLLPLLVLLLILISILCFLLARYIIRRATAPFESIQNKLRLLAGGDSVASLEPLSPSAVSSSFVEIDKVTRDIDEIADKLQLSMSALRDEKAKLDYILNNIGDGIFVIDEARNIALINSVALDIFDASTNVTDKKLNYLSFDKAIAEAVETCADQGKSSVFEVEIKGRIYYVSVKRLPQTQLNMVVLSDISEMRLSSAQREEFFANASHELKTPLTAIKGFNELAGINNSDAGLQKYIDSISRETDRMLALIGDMLKLSELETTQKVQPVAVSLSAVVEDVREMLSALIADKGIDFTMVGAAEIQAEQSHVYEVVKNLVENAVRYSNAGGQVSVRIETTGATKSLTVVDNGIGISPEEQTRIFERFYRVEKSRSEQNGGTGLGLSIVKHICVLYGWQLTLKSKLGSGTEATVVF